MRRASNVRELGAAIRARRVDRGRTQGDVAASARVSRQWLSEVEAGKPTAEVGRVLAVFDALDMDLFPVPREGHTTTGALTMTAAAAGVDLDELLDEYRQR